MKPALGALALAASARPLLRPAAPRLARAPRFTRALQSTPRRLEFQFPRDPRRPEYRRFDQSEYGQPRGPRGSGAGQNALNYVKRRVGGDRGMVIYGIGIAGAVAYYCFQCVPGVALETH